MCITINTKYKKCQAEYASPAVRLSRDFGAKIFQKKFSRRSCRSIFLAGARWTCVVKI